MKKEVLFCSCILIFCYATKKVEGKNVNPRIIGGEPAYNQQFPFIAAIDVQTSNSKFFCGGTLWSRQWVLTAGQCVNGAILFTIRLGSNTLNDEDPARVTLATSEYFLHPDFDPLTLDNDIGIIKLRMEIEFSDFVKPITQLPISDIPDQYFLRIIGWGQTSDDNSSLSNQLQFTYVNTLSNQECRITYGNQITDNMVCVAGNYNEGNCHGDTGSPLVDIYARYEFMHNGIATFISGNGCESTDPSGYTRTYPYVAWIRNVTST